MPDDAMPLPEGSENEPIQVGDELPVKIDTLMVGGERPSVDDHVEVTVGGTVSRIVDDCCYVKVETANDEEIEKPKGDYGEQDLADQSRQMDMMGSPTMGSMEPGGGY